MVRSCLYIGVVLMWMLTTSFTFAQGNFMPLTDLQIFNATTYDFRESGTSMHDIKGSPYLKDEFSEGTIVMNNITYQDVMLRYNVYNDLFEARLGKNSIVIDPVKNPIDTIYYQGNKFIRRFLNASKNNRLSHLAVLYKHGSVSLYKRYRISLVQATSPGAYAEAKPAEFDPRMPEYFLGRGDELQMLKGVKTIASFYEVDAREVKSLLKSGQLKLQREEDLISICTHFSNLNTGED